MVAALAWGAFAFGAVYPWAYWPLGAAGVNGRHRRARDLPRATGAARSA